MSRGCSSSDNGIEVAGVKYLTTRSVCCLHLTALPAQVQAGEGDGVFYHQRTAYYVASIPMAQRYRNTLRPSLTPYQTGRTVCRLQPPPVVPLVLRSAKQLGMEYVNARAAASTTQCQRTVVDVFRFDQG